MDGFEWLELNTETLRELNDDELPHVAGGMAAYTQGAGGCQLTQSPVCPSAATRFAQCFPPRVVESLQCG